jgi:hypothetical protein
MDWRGRRHVVNDDLLLRTNSSSSSATCGEVPEARTARGVIFAGGMATGAFAMLMPGMMAQQLYGEQLADDGRHSHYNMVAQLVSPGVRGFIYAAAERDDQHAGASLLNSTPVERWMFTAGCFTGASQRFPRMAWAWATFVIASLPYRTILDDPKFGGVFQYIQRFRIHLAWRGRHSYALSFQVPGAAGVVAPQSLARWPPRLFSSPLRRMRSGVTTSISFSKFSHAFLRSS